MTILFCSYCSRNLSNSYCKIFANSSYNSVTACVYASRPFSAHCRGIRTLAPRSATSWRKVLISAVS